MRAPTQPTADAILLYSKVDLLNCRDNLPRETGIMFLSRHVGDTPSMRHVLLCPPLKPDLLLHVINVARVFRCVVEPCPVRELHRHINQALAEAVQSRALMLAYTRAGQPSVVVNNCILMLPRLALLTGLTCSGIFIAGLAALILLYLLKSFFGIDIFSGAHLSGIWQ